MDQKLFSKIKELGHINGKNDELRQYCSSKIDQIIKFLPRRILNSDGGDLLDCIFKGIPDNTNLSLKHKIKIVDIVLETLRKESTSLTHCGDVISRLCLELSRLPVDDLVRWSNDSIQSIVEDKDVNMIWRDILPECMGVLSYQDNIKHCETDMSGVEYKVQCVHTLCQCRWTERQLVQLTAMFKDMQLSRNDHKQVVNKICSYIIEIPPETLPPLVHQLLKLCKEFDIEIMLAYLSHYFSAQLYSRLEPPPQDSESTTIDLDDIVQHSSDELSRCLSTCIYHISQGAAEPELIRKHIKAWPKTQLLRAPFLIDLALAFSKKGADFKTVCLDAIKSAIEQRVTDELRSKESAWARSVLPPDVDVASVLKVLTAESANHRQLTVIGLINLSFSLLSTSRTKPVANSCWSFGKLIAVRLCKGQPETASHILNQLADRLAGDCTQRQYADCLYVLCKLSPVSIERCTQLSTILENCQPLTTDYKSAAAVLDAINPLLNFSTRTRDTLVMVCRKGLYSRDSHHRCLALSGFLTVLRYMKLSSGTVSSSQSSYTEQYSTHSYLTQLTLDLHATQQGNTVTSRLRNEAVCMEVVSILRRCLVQDASVKQLLYTKIYDCAKDKPALHESILELLYEHLSKYLPESGDSNPLLLDKCIQITPITATLTEPISQLLYAIAQFIQPVEEEELEDMLASQSADTGSAHLRSKLTSVMEKLAGTEHFIQINADDSGLADLTPESRAKCLKVQQILLCYEVLVAYRVMQWSAQSTVVADSVYKICKAYNTLLELTKNSPKQGKKTNKSLNETRDTVKSQKSQKSQKEKGKGPKMANLVKDRAGPFKSLPCVWDLKYCLRVLELLYGECVSWSSPEQLNAIRSRADFHQWSLRCIHSVLTTGQIDKRDVATHVASIASILYSRCISRFRTLSEFDDQTAVSCVEVFKTCLTLLFSNNYALKQDVFLNAITGQTETTAVNIAVILQQLHAILEQMEESSDEEAFVKKLLPTVLSTASLLLETPVPPVDRMNNVILQLEDYIRSSRRDWLSLVPSLLTAGCREQQEAQLMDDLLLKLATALGRIDEEDTSAGEESSNFPSIDARSGHAVLSHVCVHMTSRFRVVEHLLYRAKDLTTALTVATRTQYQRIDKEVKELYKCISIQLCQLSSWTYHSAKLRCSVGGGSDRVLAVCVRLYSVMASLIKQIDVATAHHIRIERLLKLSGKKLSSVTDNLITYLEASQEQQSASKVLRDTKLIPRLVLEAENFSKHVILLANKAKVNWQSYLSLGTARDFRIKAPILQEVLHAREDASEGARDSDEQMDINDAATEILSLVGSDNGRGNGDSDGDATPKRRKLL